MVCEYMRKPRQTAAQREAEVKAALMKLESALRAKGISIQVGVNGAVAFRGWSDSERVGISDACAFMKLTAQGSWELKQAVARAKALAPTRTPNVRVIASGTHSHDGGATWHKGH